MADLERAKITPTIKDLLGITSDGLLAPGELEKKAPAGLELPVVDLTQNASLPVTEAKQEVEGLEEKTEAEFEVGIEEPKTGRFRNLAAKDLVKYPLIFAVALVFFYALLNFSALTKQVGSLFDRPEQPAKSIVPESFDLASYQRWVRKYYVYLNDPQVLSAEEDADGDGLVNTQEFSMETNPLLPDTDWDGYDDGREILNGFNPLYAGRLLPWQESVIAEVIDTSSIASRKQLEAVSGSSISVPSPNLLVRADLPSQQNFSLDVTKPGNLSIPKLAVDAQIIWSKVFEQMEDDLKYGLAHHPATPYPGQSGTSSIHGHSSGNPWDGDFKTVFSKLNFLEAGDEIFITVYGASGETRKYRYMVRRGQVFAKDDSRQFQAGEGYFLNLSTSWPIGTARQRYVVTTELVGL